ncbi:MAG TPA: NAD(P)-binding protein, partial [bacterium]|nr:NAD(P)-binding protein [bacterium]
MKGLKGLDDVAISRIIVEEYTKEFLAHLDCDAAVVGAGPSGLVAAQYLARGGMKVAVYERRLSVGAGMWGG